MKYKLKSNLIIKLGISANLTKSMQQVWPFFNSHYVTTTDSICCVRNMTKCALLNY